MSVRREAPERRWEVVHLDLSEGAPALPRQGDAGGLYLVFWWRGLPLGQRDVPAEALPMTAARVAAMAAEAVAPAVADRLGPWPVGEAGLADLRGLEALDALGAVCPEREGEAVGVSVVVCTRDRPEPLAACLRALSRQTRPPREVVVVDNAPASALTRRCVDGFPGVRYVAEPRRGLSAARNAGVRASTGDVVAFTDDDVEAHPDWLARLAGAFADPAVDAVTGLVLPAELETGAQRLFQRGASGFGWGFRRRRFDAAFFEATRRRGAPTWRIGAGANMAFRRRALERLGGFDERLGAGAAGCSEDSELWYRLLAEGGACLYEPAAVVFHHHRREPEALRRQMRAYMRGHTSALFAQFGRYRHGGNLYRAFVALPAYYARGLARRLAGRPAARDATWPAEVSGYLAGLLTGWRYLPPRAYDVSACEARGASVRAAEGPPATP